MSDSELSASTALLERMRARADNAYCAYIEQLRRDECLGWEIKVERGKFGKRDYARLRAKRNAIA